MAAPTDKTQSRRRGPAEVGAAREALMRRLLADAIATTSTSAFLRRALGMLLEFIGCDGADLCVSRPNGWLWSRATRGNGGTEWFGMGVRHDDPFCQEVLAALEPETAAAGVLLADARAPREAGESVPPLVYARGLCESAGCRSAALLRVKSGGEPVGILALLSNRRGDIGWERLGRLEGLTDALGAAVVSQRAFAALTERVKELTCLYEISRVTDSPAAPLEEVLLGVVELLPPAWQYPETAHARIVLEGRHYTTANFREGGASQHADIVVGGDTVGDVEVTYGEDRPELDEGPFLAEERALLNAVAREVGLIVERRRTEKEQEQLREQLIHADRLATIGQLAAGVAHELNEPLGSILGFAQLARKCPGVPPQASQDLAKIANVALYMREIIRKLLLFARQMPSARTRVDLNQIVQGALSFFEARCASSGIAMRFDAEPNLPELVGDAAQLNQVVINLVVNAVQAMPEGGELTVVTRAASDGAVLRVRDTGLGMTEEVQAQAFLPFFTTKEVGEGTGLGLPVVHGIVTAHGGRIRVESRPGEGALFEVELPTGDVPDAGEED